MGYMGFGLQNWIYRMKPRRPFSKKGKGDGFVSERGHDIDLDLFFKTNHNIQIKEDEKPLTPELKSYLDKYLGLERKLLTYKRIIIAIIVLGIFGVILFYTLKVNNNYNKPRFIKEKTSNGDYTTEFSYLVDYKNPMSIKNYYKNNLHGISVYYDSNEVESIEKYENGLLIYKIDYYKDYYIEFAIDKKGNPNKAMVHDYENNLLKEIIIEYSITSEGRLYFGRK
jgi:hypothetical protein